MKKYLLLIGLFVILFLISCDRKNNNFVENDQVERLTQNLLDDIKPLYKDGDVNAIIEIPAGSIEKWELDKTSGEIKWEIVDGKHRIINYLAYPGNYGFIPRTLLSKEKGGDGDPLDIIVIGSAVERGNVIKCKIIGILYLMDRGEQDDKIIAVQSDSPLKDVNNIAELNDAYNGITEILQLWFTNYKGPGKMESKGFGERKEAMQILKSAIEDYQLH